MKEIKTILITGYRTPDGSPTCAYDFETGEVCCFYRTSKFGTREECALDTGEDMPLKRRPRTRDGKIGEGYLVPGKNCVIWETEK